MELKKLRSLREAAGYSHGVMARMLGISKVYYWQIENGGRRLYYFMAIKIAKIFEKKPDELFFNDIS